MALSNDAAIGAGAAGGVAGLGLVAWTNGSGALGIIEGALVGEGVGILAMGVTAGVLVIANAASRAIRGRPLLSSAAVGGIASLVGVFTAALTFACLSPGVTLAVLGVAAIAGAFWLLSRYGQSRRVAAAVVGGALALGGAHSKDPASLATVAARTVVVEPRASTTVPAPASPAPVATAPLLVAESDAPAPLEPVEREGMAKALGAAFDRR